MQKTCEFCFQVEGECYLSCPSQDPWNGDHYLEDLQSQPVDYYDGYDKGDVE